MIPEHAPDHRVCHLLRRHGQIVGSGKKIAYRQAGQQVEWFSSFAERESPELDNWRRAHASLDLERQADNMKTATEYPGKRSDAEKWLALHPIEDNATLPPSGYHYMRAEVEVCGCTPFEAATSIRLAVEADAARVRARVELREKARTLPQSTE